MAVGVGAGLYARFPASSSRATSTRTTALTENAAQTSAEGFTYPVSLRATADARGLLIGSAADTATLDDSRFADVLGREFNAVTPIGMGWSSIDCCGYESADALVKFASEHQMEVRGANLIWRGDLPNRINESTSADAFRSAMQAHISEEVSRYRGKVYAWDVVNEAVDSDGLRKTIFLEKLGEGYIADAFV